jgi:hypothetical protein
MESNGSSHTESQTEWQFLGKPLPKTELVFFSQVLILYIVIITCIANLSLGSDDSNLFVVCAYLTIFMPPIIDDGED